MSTIRRGQLVVPFGVGAIVEIGQESYSCADLSRWSPDEAVGINPSELARITGRQVRTPAKSAPFVRFPRWLFCPSCRRMRLLTEMREAELNAKGYSSVRCAPCKKVDMTPMGFVQACTNGHLDEIDWFRWAHRDAQPAVNGQCERSKADLRFITTGARGGDWETLEVRCEACKARNNLEGLTTRPLPWKCRGRQPWVNKDSACDQKPFGHRRGDSNLYFPETLSAIDVVVEGSAPTEGLQAYIGTLFVSGKWAGMLDMLKVFGGQAAAERLMPQLVDIAAQRSVMTSEVVEALVAVIEGRVETSSDDTGLPMAVKQEAVLAGEWPVLARGSSLETTTLIIRPQQPGTEWPEVLKAAFSRINLVPRLREVRGLLGYRRVDSSAGVLLGLDPGNERSWIPGVEVWGEGIFLQLDESLIADWESSLHGTLATRIVRLGDRYESTGRDRARVSARFIALHTLSHTLLRRLAFDAGYSSTALRERIYAGPGMAGILIYTADGDSEGSLGGLVRMGDPVRLGRSITAALHDVSWCSADPVCGETSSQGVKGLNGAACHACSLIAETSCAYGNQLLDRHFLLKGDGGHLANGLLSLPPIKVET